MPVPPAPTRYVLPGLSNRTPLLAFRTQTIEGDDCESPDRLLLSLVPDTHKQHPFDVVTAFLDEIELAPDPTVVEHVSFVVDVNGCARCHTDTGHPGVAFRAFTHPVTSEVGGGGDLLYTHWALCPTTGEPIMLRMVPSDG